MKKLFAGAWLAEFGWELMAWNGFLRAISDQYDEVIVAGPTGHEGIYEFATKYIPYDVPTDTANMWMNRPEEKRAYEFMTRQFDSRNHLVEYINPANYWDSLARQNKGILVNAIKPQEFKHFGTDTDIKEENKYDILYHARNCDNWDSGFRNWNPIDVKKVLNEFPDKRIGCIGRKGRAFYCGGDDLRDIPLSELTAIMSDSKLLVGPLSGPIHLATLSVLPQVTWVTKAEHRQRVEKTWNPFGVKTAVIQAESDRIWTQRIPWTPEPHEIINEIKKILGVAA